MISVLFLVIFSNAAVASTTASAPLSFDEAIRTMLGRDTEIGAVGEEAEAIDALALGKRYHFLPTIQFDATESWPRGLERTTSLLGTARLPLFRFGADLLASDAASSASRSARAKLERVRLERESVSVSALLEYIRTYQAREILAALVKMGEESVGVAERQFSSGRIAAQEVLKVKIDVENARFQMAEAEQAWVNARARVEALLGSAEVVPEFPWKTKIEALHAAKVDAAEILKLRPEWIEAEALSRSAFQRSRGFFRELLPSLVASGSYGWTKDPAVAPDYRLGWIAALTVSIPLFNGFRDYAVYREADATANAAESRMEGVKRDVRSEAVSIPSRYEIARKNALDREKILKSSHSLYQDNLSRFRQGRASSDELNVDLKRYLETQLGALSGWVSAHDAFVQLAHLRGQCATECGK